MSKRSRVLEVKHSALLQSRVFEDGSDVPEEIEFVYQDLRRWGFDLWSGKRDGASAWFLSEVEEKRKAGDRYQTEEGDFEIEMGHESLPPNTRLLGRLRMEDGRAWLMLSLQGGVQEERLARIPAAELLVWYLGKEGLFQIVGAVRNVGTLTMLETGRGQEGKGVPLEKMPAHFRQVLQKARKLNRELGAGRLAFTGFGQAKDRRWRYRLVWELPTLALFQRDTAERIDKMLEALHH